MISTDFAQFKKLAKKGNRVAVLASISADLETPVSAFFKLAHREKHAFLLESAEQGEQVGRYSFIGLNPAMILEAQDKKVKITEKKKQKLVGGKHLIELLEKKLSEIKLANPNDVPGSAGGFVGYFSYENVEFFENIKLRRKGKPTAPEGIFFLTQDLVIFDHFRKTLTLVSLAETNSAQKLKKAYRNATQKIEDLVAKLRKPLRIPKRPKSPQKKPLFRSNMTQAQFSRKVERVKEYIRAGDCIQVVLSQKFSMPAPKNDFQIYRALRSVNPSPYMFYFRSGKSRIIGSSPELLVKKTGRTAEVRPIAGTRPRGKNSREDAVYEESLKKSPKEMAEHLMLVDLGRNDIGRVCQFNTIEVEKFARIEHYSHVMHLVSDVSGKLKPGKSAFDLLKASFPAGTVSGAPKVRAMQIINELEPEMRGPYAGALGYFGFNQDMDMCITIRTLVLDGKRIYLQAGAGIVKDSSPAREYEETFNKAKALFKAISMQEDF